MKPRVIRSASRPRWIAALLVVGWILCSQVRAACADHVFWFNPTGAKQSGFGAILPGTTPQALRINHSGAGSGPQSGSVAIPLSITSEHMIDSLYVCYRILNNEVPSRITGITLRTMALPFSAPALMSDAALHTSTSGECLGLDVSDATPFGAPDITISYTIEMLSYVEIGAIGIKVKVPTVGVNQPEDSPATLALAPGRPNPFTRSTRIGYAVSATGPVRLQIIDAAGRVVRTLVDRTLAPGQYDEWWDGRDDAGRALAHGVYFSRVSSDREKLAERLVLLR